MQNVQVIPVNFPSKYYCLQTYVSAAASVRDTPFWHVSDNCRDFTPGQSAGDKALWSAQLYMRILHHLPKAPGIEKTTDHEDRKSQRKEWNEAG